MIDPLLYEVKIVPIDIIKRKSSDAANVDIKYINIHDRAPLARKREFVTARQVSMKLSKKYTTQSLSAIGFSHGGRDHATVLHACKTVDALLDTKDIEMTAIFNKAENLIRKWRSMETRRFSAMKIEEKTELVKKWIKAKVPLHIREQKLLDYNRECPHCGHIMKPKQ